MDSYKFNYCGAALPICNEETILQDIFVKITYSDILIIYNMGKTPEKEYINIPDPLTLLLISTTNSAHSMSEIIDFLQYYNDHQNTIKKIGISRIIQKRLPLLFSLISMILPENKIVILEDSMLYKCSRVTTYRLNHFNYVKNWDAVAFTTEIHNQKKRLVFESIQHIQFICNPESLIETVRSIYSQNKHRYCLYDRIMLIKTNKDPIVSSVNRCMEFPTVEIINKLQSHNIHFVTISDFKNIEEYICVLYHAKTLIFSYGGPACTNRFFCNPSATVIVLANTHYRPEYEYDNDSSLYWHVRHSHLFPVTKQYFLLDFSNSLNDENVQEIVDIV